MRIWLYPLIGLVLLNIGLLEENTLFLVVLSLPFIGIGFATLFKPFNKLFSFLELLIAGILGVLSIFSIIQFLSYFISISALLFCNLFIVVLTILHLLDFNKQVNPEKSELFIICLSFIFLVLQLTRNLHMMGTEDEYAYAWSILHPSTFLALSNIFRVFFSLVLAFFGELHFSLLFLRYVMIFLSSLLPIVTYLIGSLFSKRLAWFASLLVVVFPTVWFNSPRLYSDIFLAITLSFSLFLFLRYSKERNRSLLFSSYIFLTLSFLIKQSSFIFFPLFFFSRSKKIKLFLIMSFVLLVFSLPSLSFLVTDSFEFLRSLSDNLGIIQNRLASLFGHTALLIGLPLLIFLGKRKIPKQILLAILIFYYSVFAFILVYWAHGTRHLLFVLPIFSFLVVYSFKKVFTPRIFFLAVTLLFVVLISFSSLFFPVQSDEFLSDAASWIFQNTNSSDSILSNAYTALTVYANQEITSVPRRRIEFERLIENHSVDYLIVLHLYPLRHYERWPYLSDYIASESNDSHLDLVYTKSGKDPTTKVFSQIISVYKVE